ncbi:hypothetical protein [Streptomyces sp. NPDC058694]|uniref:hypothetical protein n=1 Tax=Streptomyces sp. NPDC058694 TaxID=3346603 RepID=UPI00365E268B
MPAVTRRRMVVLALTTIVLSFGTSPAAAGGFDGSGSQQETETSGGSSGPSLESRVSFTVQGGSQPTSSGPLTSTSANWKPPACWYEPYWEAKDFKTFMEAQWSIYESAGGSDGGTADDKARYKEGEPYEDFNADKNGKGMWWVAVENPGMKDEPAAGACQRDPFWVNNGEDPYVPQAIDTETLAGLAYQQTKVPDTEISSAPEAKSTVNLPTWVWLDKATFKTVSVTADLPGTGLWATTTAKPVSLHVEPGTDDAETYPSSGECAINDDGSIGEPYAKGKAEKTPPCGVRYLRSSGDDPYELRATLTWEISWEGAGNTAGDLPNGTFATTTEVPVQEIQSVNR